MRLQRTLLRNQTVGQYLVRVSAWLSQGVNCIFLGGHHDQTVSARAYLNRYRHPWRAWYITINKVFFWQEDHCYESHMRDIEFAKALLRTLRSKQSN